MLRKASPSIKRQGTSVISIHQCDTFGTKKKSILSRCLDVRQNKNTLHHKKPETVHSQTVKHSSTHNPSKNCIFRQCCAGEPSSKESIEQPENSREYHSIQSVNRTPTNHAYFRKTPFHRTSHNELHQRQSRDSYHHCNQVPSKILVINSSHPKDSLHQGHSKTAYKNCQPEEIFNQGDPKEALSPRQKHYILRQEPSKETFDTCDSKEAFYGGSDKDA